MKKLTYIIPAVVITAISIGVFIITPFNSASANPDYICIKDVNRACEVKGDAFCTDWIAGQRTCEGTRTTKVSYFLTRTSCEAGYTKVR
jgi:hypothetical protein